MRIECRLLSMQILGVLALAVFGAIGAWLGEPPILLCELVNSLMLFSM